MQQKIKLLFKDTLISRTVKIFIILAVCYIFVGVWKWRDLPPQLPLFYSLPRSHEQLGTPSHLVLLPFFSLFTFILNFFLASVLYPREKLAATMLIIIGTIATLLLFTTFARIIFLIT